MSETPDACRAGHPYTPENTRTRPNGQRACRTCEKVRRDKEAEERRSLRLRHG